MMRLKMDCREKIRRSLLFMKINLHKISIISLGLALLLSKTAKADSTVLEVGFVTEAAVKDGVFRVLIPTATDSANLGQATGVWNGGAAVSDAFVTQNDGGASITVTCPSDVSGFTFGTPALQLGSVYYDLTSNKELTQAEATAANGKFVRYLGFLCPYTGDGTIGSQFATGTNSIKISGLTDPVASAGTAINEAVVMPGKIQLLKSGYTNDKASGEVANYVVSDRDVVISAFTKEVVLTAQVNASLGFKIAGLSAGANACGKPTTVASTPLAVNYGAPTVNTFVDAAQQLQVISSSSNGYAVTVQQNSNLARTGTSEDCVTGETGGTIKRDCIPNFGWSEATPLTAAASMAWTDSAKTGFGYTMAKNSGDGSVAALFTGGNNGYYSRFSTGTPTAVFTSASTSAQDGDVFEMCYRLSLDAQNNAGVYNNYLTYTVTASF